MDRPLTKEELIEVLHTLPAGTLMYVRQRDDAYPLTLKVFRDKGDDTTVAYVMNNQQALGWHRNYPEEYGQKPMKIEIPANKETANA
jgi:hypothetical protein